MKLSTKFFCTAYLIILLSAGIGGALLINNVNSALVSARTERIKTAVNYAIDSFCVFADSMYENMNEAQKEDALRQIKRLSDSTVFDIKIYNAEEFPDVPENTTLSHYDDTDGRLIMRSVSKINTSVGVYCLEFLSDFTDIKKQCEGFWSNYATVVVVISAISGILLFVFALKITYPLKILVKVTNGIAAGNYGKKVRIKTSDTEIEQLIKSINSMSLAVEQKIAEIQQEVDKRNTFVADFTHELKTPMTAIMGYSRMLSSYHLDEKEIFEASDMIYNEAKRLEKLSLQLLDLYVYQNDTVEMETINVTDISDHLNSTCKYLSEKYNVNFKIKFSACMVYANKVLLISLLYNLIDNAFKASSPQDTVEVYSRIEKDRVCIYVRDTGRGIAKEKIKLLTEPFYREDKSRSRKYGGAGLGLSLCKAIVELHNSELKIDSEKGEGTTVSFSLKRGR